MQACKEIHTLSLSHIPSHSEKSPSNFANSLFLAFHVCFMLYTHFTFHSLR